MANSPKFAGKEVREKRGWWHAYRFLFWRRLTQFGILMMFLSGPYFGVWILKGNYSGSLLFDVIPLSDPLITLESLSTGHLPGTLTLIGALIIFTLYALLGSKVFCGWVCPLNVVTDCAAWIRRKLGIRQTAKIPRGLRYAILLMILAGSAVSGLLLWEWINPVAALGRALIYSFGATAWLILAVFLFDLFIVEHGWCGHLCPIGATYGVIGAKSLIRVKVIDRARCDNCMDCYNVCPEPQVLRSPLHGKNNESLLVLSQDCISCGRCIDVCAENVLTFSHRFNNDIPIVTLNQ
ncbi:quinol dehydrogenase ferredoxin subunit NapH [Aggregatibacter actinomycetemcomitans]|uniref:quinol dehydrogenase ferredoxin subunit NapH n=1 Tax=Aggregatibacter actinomycetemcomitans TaxID=714 RepID=UPI00022ABA68|nr:quinol dehydrogenase ferredoxin subunit NapH [Aggregatibacter actinomycetemcomitans]KYK96241.1 quinol dehydrogenase [Aggregatibacter actinomycetemcomitans serotype d str. SA3733]ANU81593.1 quinol dehydrogenase ferredoxin subunit NapH [Aggregatibacter actinomycetemcomitans]KOE67278.1 quinol dehydrogenase [Aggregatibacter actinomycetemcomitans serotype d str. I63B]KYK84136.1 quinol dehydrogenase [Aggregatibacter actinomycetemcomitans serotype d str. SA3033]KYK88709.1 quinol dehydrogenase [Agg